MKKIKLALLALMGFSTACSTVKTTTKSEESKSTTEQSATTDEAAVSDSTVVAMPPAIKLMYGVPRPKAEPSEPATEQPATGEQDN